MDPKPADGRAQIALHLFPVADLPLSGAEPLSGVTYGRAVNGMTYHDPVEVELVAPSSATGNGTPARKTRETEARIGSYGGDGLRYLVRHGENSQLRKELSLEWCEEQWQKQDGRCHWTGIPLIRRMTAPGHPERRDPRFVSIERLDPDKGYTPDNCVLACRFVNFGRNDYTGDFVEFLRQLSAALKAKFPEG